MGWLRQAARGLPYLWRDGFQILPEGGLLILLSLSYKQVVTLSGMPVPILSNGNMETQKMKSQKQFITLSTKTGICQQRHTIIGERSLSASSSVALGNLLRPRVVKKSLVAETQCLCMCGDRCGGKHGGCGLSSVPSLHYSPLAHAPGSQCESVWGSCPGPQFSSSVSPGSPPQTWPHSSPPVPLYSWLSHSAPAGPWDPILLCTLQRPVWPVPPSGPHRQR